MEPVRSVQCQNENKTRPLPNPSTCVTACSKQILSKLRLCYTNETYLEQTLGSVTQTRPTWLFFRSVNNLYEREKFRLCHWPTYRRPLHHITNKKPGSITVLAYPGTSSRGQSGGRLSVYDRFVTPDCLLPRQGQTPSTGLRPPSSNHCHNWLCHRTRKTVS